MNKYDAPKALLKSCGKTVFHVTYEDQLKKIKEEGLHDFWFGIDMYDCCEMVELNHDHREADIAIAIPVKLLDPEKCDFTCDSGDGWSDTWAGTGMYHGTIDVSKCSIHNIED